MKLFAPWRSAGPLRVNRSLAALTLIMVTTYGSSMAGAEIVDPADAPPEVAQRLHEARDLLAQQGGPPLELPANPQVALAEAVTRFLTVLQVPVEDPVAKIAATGLSDAVAGRLATMLTALEQCAAATDRIFRSLGLGVIGAALQGKQSLDKSVGAGIRSCAPPALKALHDLEVELAPTVALAAALGEPDCKPSADDLDLWPVLRVDTNENSCYVRDYVLVVDTHGNDRYDNNAGANLIDLRRELSRAQGCRHAIPGLAARDCTPVAGAVLDMHGNDRYGVKEPAMGDLTATDAAPTVEKPDYEPAPPFTDRPGDAHCTSDELVARLMTQGAGFAGVGLLRDTLGNDRYTAKTGAQGTGHVFGLGYLSDGAGSDRYEAIRNSQGFALVSGIGILSDQGGNDDVYAFYTPAARTPGLDSTEEPVFIGNGPDQTFVDEDGDGTPEAYLNPNSGIGGAIDDVQACDRMSRFVQGAANVLGLGVLVDDGGKDRYASGNQPNDGDPPLRITEMTGSQGFGNNGAVGVLVDRGGSDRYEGMDARFDNVIHTDCTRAGGFGLFVDTAPPGATPQTSSECPHEEPGST